MTGVFEQCLPARGPDRPSPTSTPEDLTILPPRTSPWFTVIVATRDEAEHVDPWLRALAAGLGGAVTEVLFVDDSADDTPDVIRRAARTCRLAVRLLHRPPGRRPGGLGGAIVAGLHQARGTWAVVIGVDGEYPPDLAARLVAVGQARQLDLVAGSRVAGSRSGPPGAISLAGRHRRLRTAAATAVTKAIFPRRLSRLSDPMSGAFAVRLAALDLTRLDPIGSGVLLDIAVRQPALRTAEVPIVIGIRADEYTRRAPADGVRFVRHMARLRGAVFRRQFALSAAVPPSLRLRRLLGFGLVGLSGAIVNTVVLWAVSAGVWHSPYLLAAILATETSTTWNFALTETLVFRRAKPGTALSRGLSFFALNHTTLLLRLPILALLVEGFGAGVLSSNALTLAMMFAVRFLVADSAIYASASERVGRDEPIRLVVDVGDSDATVAPRLAATRRVSVDLPFCYRIASVLAVGSHVRLPELDSFRVQSLDRPVDLSIRTGNVGRGIPRHRASMTTYARPRGVGYEEHYGRLGANFRVDVGEHVEVVVSRALASSPHVLYATVLKSLLRFVAVSRGLVLLQSACVEIDGKGVLLSAGSDVGSMRAGLRIMRAQGALVLSDDVTIIDPRCRATGVAKLSERADMTFMGVNSLTRRGHEALKYARHPLEATVTRARTMDSVFLLEHGAPAVPDVPSAEAIHALVTNTDDVCGFGALRAVGPSVFISEHDYDELRRQERAILTSALRGVPVTRLAAGDAGWAERFAAFFGEGAEVSALAG